MTIDQWEALPWWQQHVYQDYLLKQGQAQQPDDDTTGRAPDPPSNGDSTLDPFAPMLLMQQAGFTAEIAQPPK